jgi:hypothetical protein
VVVVVVVVGGVGGVVVVVVVVICYVFILECKGTSYDVACCYWLLASGYH